MIDDSIRVINELAEEAGGLSEATSYVEGVLHGIMVAYVETFDDLEERERVKKDLLDKIQNEQIQEQADGGL